MAARTDFLKGCVSKWFERHGMDYDPNKVQKSTFIELPT